MSQSWMLTYTGLAYWPSDPHPRDVSLIDIAHHLSMLCRFTGAVRRFYSVAEHCYHVSTLVQPKHALVGLLHDAPEAYINDLNRPVKHGLGLAGYRDIEQRNWLAIAAALELPEVIPPEVHQVDAEMLYHERAALLPLATPQGLEYGMGRTPPRVVRPELIKAWDWQTAKSKFLARYNELTRRVG